MKNFFADAIDNWDDESGQIHAYLVPGDRFVNDVRERGDALCALPFLGVQPKDALHITVGRFPAFAREVDELDAIRCRLQAQLHDVGEVDVTWGSAAIVDSSVIVRGSSSQWTTLTEAVNQALGRDRGRHGYQPPASPHVTLAYGIGDGDDAAIWEALDTAARPPLVPESFQHLDLCAVHQDQVRGTYTFQVLSSLPLR